MLSLDLRTREKIKEMHRLDLAIDGYILSEKDCNDLVIDAYTSNVHWSTKIEGNRMTLEDVRTLATEFTTGKIKEEPNGPRQEILNRLGFLFEDIPTLPWTTDMSSVR